MAKGAGQVTLRGRFSPGDVVRLVKVAGEHVLRAEGGEEIEVKTVTEEKDAPRVGYVQFSRGVDVGARYFVTGLNDGRPLEVRITGRSKDDPAEVLEQPPIQPDRQRMADGTWRDEGPTKESAPHILAGQADIRHVKKGTVLRSDTPRGEAHPLDPEERAPKRTQDDVKKGTVQMSDTRTREAEGVQVGAGGEAAELVLGPQRQEDVPKGVLQRSDTPTGVAQPIPAGDAVQQAMDRESSFAKETRGEPVRASAEPLDAKGIKVGPPTGSTQKASEKRDADLKRSEREGPAELAAKTEGDQPADEFADDSGTDAQGQPADPEAASEESERRSKAARKAARTRKRNEAKQSTSGSSTSSEEQAPREQDRPAQSKQGPITGAATTSTTAKER